LATWNAIRRAARIADVSISDGKRLSDNKE